METENICLRLPLLLNWKKTSRKKRYFHCLGKTRSPSSLPEHSHSQLSLIFVQTLWSTLAKSFTPMADVVCHLALSVVHMKVKIPPLGCSLLLTPLLLLLPPRLGLLCEGWAAKTGWVACNGALCVEGIRQQSPAPASWPPCYHEVKGSQPSAHPCISGVVLRRDIQHSITNPA